MLAIVHSVKYASKVLKHISNVQDYYYLFLNIATTRIMLKHISKVLKHDGNVMNIESC